MSYSRTVLPAPGNPFKVGDSVKLDFDLKDGYGDTWVSKGEHQRIQYFADDGKGCMFVCGLGAHFRDCIPVGACKQRIERENLIERSKKVAVEFSTGHGA